MRVARVVLIGFSGGGKSTVGRELADRLGWSLVDTDAELEAAFGRSVPEIFTQDGEPAFREAEQRVLLQALERDEVVIACGGGAVLDPALWTDNRLECIDTLVIALDVSPQTALVRLRKQQAMAGAEVERPLLAGTDPLTKIAALKQQRQAVYDRADATLMSDRLTPGALAADIASLVAIARRQLPDQLMLQAPSGTSRIVIGPETAHRAGELIRETWPSAHRIWLVTDDGVGPKQSAPVVADLGVHGLEVQVHAVRQGEGSKSLAGLAELYDWMLGHGCERGDVVVALGGGMVGDLAGFAAATCLRGLRLVQLPTSLLAMVDSSVGGKTGINHAAGKNLIGAFYQPPLVVIDSTFLATLPARELTSGWAEIIKHAVIQPATPGGEAGDLLPLLERNRDRLLAREEPILTYLIRRNVALKAAVVEQDEREAGGRAMLNFGHTLGHAIEAADYRYLHGEAVAIGMRGVMRIGAAMGTCTEDDVARLDAVLDAYGLPRHAEANPDRVLSLIGSDKKRTAGRQRWILPMQGGGIVIRDDVPERIVRKALAEIICDSTLDGE